MTDPQRHSQAALLIPILGAVATVSILVWLSSASGGGIRSVADPFVATLLGLSVLPYLIIGLALSLGRANNWVWWPALVYGTIATLFGLGLSVVILIDSSSTAVLGFLVLPIYQLLGMIPVVLAVAIAYLIRSRSHRQNTPS